MMTIDEAIECYLEILRRVFSTKKFLARNAVFSATELEKVMGGIVARQCGDSNELMIEKRGKPNSCKAWVVLSMRRDNLTDSQFSVVYAVTADAIRAGIITSIRSYRVTSNQGPECTIVEAVRATTATPEMFKRAVIEEQGVKIPYIGGGLGCNNPMSQLLLEAGRAFPSVPLACVVSVGAGQLSSTNLPEPRMRDLLMSSKLIDVVKSIAMDCEKTHQETSNRFNGTSDVYFRFNAEQGMQDIDQSDATRLPNVQTHTRVYLQEATVDARAEGAAKAVAHGRGALELRGVYHRILSTEQIG
jgi:hypothetical protein